MAAGVAILALTGCGGGGPAQPAGSAKITMTDFRFDPASPSVPAGKSVFYLVNSGSSGHDLVITKDRGGSQVIARSSLVAGGDAGIFTVANLASGSYFFRCDVPGHAESGMVGTLTVS